MSKLRITPFMKQCFVTAAVCFTTIGHGSAVGFSAILLPQLEKSGSNMTITKEIGSWIVSVSAFTLLLGGFLTSPLMGRLGRRIAHFVVITSTLLGWVVILFSNNIGMVILGRSIHGISFGLMLPLRSVLIGEYTSPKNRGAFITIMSFSQAFGILIVHFTGSLATWQHTVLILSSFPLMSLIMTFFTPETPSWLADKGRYQQSKEVFRWLRGDGEEAELAAMISATSSQKNKAPVSNCRDLVNLIKKRRFYKPIIIMVHCYMMTEFCGGALMSNYSTTVIGLVAGPEVNVNFWMVTFDIQRNLTSLLAVFVVRRVSRRTMILTTGGLCALSHLALACYVYTRHIGVMTYTATWLPILLISIQFFTVAMGMLTLPYVIAGEIFPLEYRSIGGSISIIAIASGYFVVTKTFPSLVQSIGIYGAYALYGCFLFYNWVVVWAMLPETKGKTLQEIEEYFKGKSIDSKDVELKEPLKDNKENFDKYTIKEIATR